ncbi:MAG: thioredoxin family protein [Saprospiraceae bacterium]|nr:thioredoxin family protein [Saprospiraceae bacterium]
MKLLQVLIVCVFFAGSAMAQTADYKAGNPGWMVDLDEAYAASKKQGKPIMANFTGSDWCGWCKRLTAAVFSKKEFQTWAEDNVILLELDFPRRTRIPDQYRQQNANLQQAFKVRGFPTIWVFNMDKDVNGQYKINALGKTGYAPSVQQFIGAVEPLINKS